MVILWFYLTVKIKNTRLQNSRVRVSSGCNLIFFLKRKIRFWNYERKSMANYQRKRTPDSFPCHSLHFLSPSNFQSLPFSSCKCTLPALALFNLKCNTEELKSDSRISKKAKNKKQIMAWWASEVCVSPSVSAKSTVVDEAEDMSNCSEQGSTDLSELIYRPALGFEDAFWEWHSPHSITVS